MRNNWGLWKGSRLSKWFNSQGIKHTDDMSGVILVSYYRHLNGKPIELEKQIQYYKNYWAKTKAREEEGNGKGQEGFRNHQGKHDGPSG